jgi:hypothetical protein
LGFLPKWLLTGVCLLAITSEAYFGESIPPIEVVSISF